MAKDAIGILVAEHRKIEKLFDSARMGERKSRESATKELEEALLIHMTEEEDAFYPAAQELLRGSMNFIEHSEMEHDRFRELLEVLVTTDVDEKRFMHGLGALFILLKEHVKEEERVIFPAVRKLMSPQDLDVLAGEMKDIKESVQQLASALRQNLFTK